MRPVSSALLLFVLLTAGAQSQAALPPDIHPESLSRLPPVQRGALDADGQRIYDTLAGAGKALTRTGSSAVTKRARAPSSFANKVARSYSSPEGWPCASSK